MPVSYTHLDVYKRQAVYCQRCDEMYITEGTYNAFISDKDKNKMETEFVLDFFR